MLREVRGWRTVHRNTENNDCQRCLNNARHTIPGDIECHLVGRAQPGNMHLLACMGKESSLRRNWKINWVDVVTYFFSVLWIASDRLPRPKLLFFGCDYWSCRMLSTCWTQCQDLAVPPLVEHPIAAQHPLVKLFKPIQKLVIRILQCGVLIGPFFHSNTDSSIWGNPASLLLDWNLHRSMISYHHTVHTLQNRMITNCPGSPGQSF